MGKLNLKIQPARRPHDVSLEVSKLAASDKLSSMKLSSENQEENWAVFQNEVDHSADSTLGLQSHEPLDCFDVNDEEIQRFLRKHHLHKPHRYT